MADLRGKDVSAGFAEARTRTGRVLHGCCRPVRRLGAGGMAEVVLARWIGTAQEGRLVAVKRLLPHLRQHADYLQMFHDEAALLCSLSHPCIIAGLGRGDDSEGPYLVMEYVHGRSLQQVIEHARRYHLAISLPAALTVCRDVASALDHAHGLPHRSGVPGKLVHRDVTPSNVLLGFAGVTKLADFGIAKGQHRHAVTATGMVRGKLAYLAPEQVRGRPVDLRADIYALGVVAYELTTGASLWPPGSPPAYIVSQLLCGRISADGLRAPGYPAALREIIASALAIEARQRFSSAGQFLCALEEFATVEGLELGPPAVADLLSGWFRRDDLPGLPLDHEAIASTVSLEERRECLVPAVGSPAPPRVSAPIRKPARRRRWPLAVIALVTLLSFLHLAPGEGPAEVSVEALPLELVRSSAPGQEQPLPFDPPRVLARGEPDAAARDREVASALVSEMAPYHGGPERVDRPHRQPASDRVNPRQVVPADAAGSAGLPTERCRPRLRQKTAQRTTGVAPVQVNSGGAAAALLTLPPGVTRGTGPAGARRRERPPGEAGRAGGAAPVTGDPADALFQPVWR
jgi:serine/threonine-protein kinase